MKVLLQAWDANEEERIDPATYRCRGKSFEVEARAEWSIGLLNRIEARLEGFRPYGNYQGTNHYVEVTFDEEDVLKLVRLAIKAGKLPPFQKLLQARESIEKALVEYQILGKTLTQLEKELACVVGPPTKAPETQP